MSEESSVSNTPDQVRNESENKPETIAYETHRKLLSQRKSDQEKMRGMEQQLNDLLNANKEAEEAKLREQGKWEDLAGQRENKIKELEQENLGFKDSFDKAVKLTSFRDQLGGTVDNSSYYDFVNVKDIVIDPETGVVDTASVEQVVNQFKKDHSKLYTPKVSKSLPANAPRDTNAMMTTPTNKNEIANALKDELAKQFN